ncbi:MAG: hypothetical protein ACK4YP_27465, partial [Myxococcota bacterium]
MTAPRSVSAFFTTEPAVDDAIARLELGGLPRDRIEVVVSEAGTRTWYGKRADTGKRQPLAGAGAG